MYQPAGVGSIVELDKTMGPPKQVVHRNTRFPKADTPAVNAGNTRLGGAGGRDFSLMRSPSPAPGAGASPVITWGRIDGTPVMLDGGLGDVQPNPFNLAPSRKREQVNWRLLLLLLLFHSLCFYCC